MAGKTLAFSRHPTRNSKSKEETYLFVLWVFLVQPKCPSPQALVVEIDSSQKSHTRLDFIMLSVTSMDFITMSITWLSFTTESVTTRMSFITMSIKMQVINHQVSGWGHTFASRVFSFQQFHLWRNLHSASRCASICKVCLQVRNPKTGLRFCIIITVGQIGPGPILATLSHLQL